MGPAELVQAITVARAYFLAGQSKVDIAAELGISRYKVARILDACLAEGIVRIEISAPDTVNPELSQQLQKRFALKHALVVSSTHTDTPTLRRAVGSAAAALLSEIVSEEDVLGVAWGRTLDAMAAALTTLARCPIVQMTGATGAVNANSINLMRRLAEVSGSAVFPIYAPLLVSDEVTVEALHRQPGIVAATSRFGQITKAAVAVGSWDFEGSQLYSAMAKEDLARLRGVPVAAEVCSILLDEAGTPVDTEINRRTIAVRAETLRRIPEVIAVAGGESKAGAILAVLRGGLATSLVTDEAAAGRLLASVDD
ncbi:MAG TPA: sugar-binding domain-containing protein [Pseudonocardiaceae bacterium]|jgi:DNA-binding transcriptional regulator LsrR (DeoR family)|nr:sugar-binding domain-containing protein [Pseudonocardiaceae bacterium]